MDPPSSSRALPVLLLTVFIGIVGFGIVIPLLPFYGKAFGAPAWQITLMFSVYSLGQFAGELTWGRLSDRIGRRPVLLITNLTSAASYAAFAFAPDIGTAIAVRAASGFFSGNVSTIQGYIADVSPRERLVGRLGLVGGALGAGFVLGPSIGGLLARSDIGAAGFRLPLLLAAGLFAVAAAGVFLFVRESRTAPRGGRTAGQLAVLGAALVHPTLRRLLAITFVSTSAFSAMWSVLAFWGETQFGWGPKRVGLVMALVGAGSALGQGVVARMVSRRAGEIGTIAGGLVVALAFILVQAFSPWAGLAVLALFLVVISYTMTQPATMSLISQAADPRHQGSTLGANAAASSLARVGGPVLGGALYSSFGVHAPFLLAAAGMAPAIWLALGARHSLKEPSP